MGIKRVISLVLCCLVLGGCVNKYEEAVRENLSSAPYWQDAGYYIQRINTYEMLESYCVGGRDYVECFAYIAKQNNPYDEMMIKLFVDKKYPTQYNIPYCKEWWDFIRKLQREKYEELKRISGGEEWE